MWNGEKLLKICFNIVFTHEWQHVMDDGIWFGIVKNILEAEISFGRNPLFLKHCP